jgi:hypothetical protein
MDEMRRKLGHQFDLSLPPSILACLIQLPSPSTDGWWLGSGFVLGLDLTTLSSYVDEVGEVGHALGSLLLEA